MKISYLYWGLPLAYAGWTLWRFQATREYFAGTSYDKVKLAKFFALTPTATPNLAREMGRARFA